MKYRLILGCALSTAVVLLAGNAAQAQHHHHHGSQYYQPRAGSRYVVRGNNNRGGTYYCHNNGYYYNAGGRDVRVEYGGFSHVDELASRLESLANSFCLEIYYNYDENPNFDETYREAYEILEIAKYIHEEEHHGHRDEIAKEVDRLDNLFHHVKNAVAHWRPNRGHHHHHDRLPPKDQLLEEMESVIHHLMHDVGVKPRNAPDPDRGRGDYAPSPNNLRPNFRNLPSGS